ncbi:MULTISPECIES: hypothetical protein [unclassified Mesorhizobium]|uniref:hypothetical protein n=1 Tax=unclassified Mesorhizobium TaxID=325217 RepID=UPI00333B3290
MPLDSLIDQYVSSRKRRGLLSTRHALEALKEALPALSIGESHLVNMIAERALAFGLAIHFDHSGENAG